MEELKNNLLKILDVLEKLYDNQLAASEALLEMTRDYLTYLSMRKEIEPDKAMMVFGIILESKTSFKSRKAIIMACDAINNNSFISSRMKSKLGRE